MRHVGSFSDQGSNPGPRTGNLESQPLYCQGSPQGVLPNYLSPSEVWHLLPELLIMLISYSFRTVIDPLVNLLLLYTALESTENGTVLFSIAAVTNYHNVGDLKLQKFIIL